MATKSKSRFPRRNRWMWFAWLPLVVFGACFGFDFIHRKSSNDLLAKYREKALQEGAPVDAQSFVRWYERRTHSEGSERWGRIGQMILTPVNPERTPVLGNCQLPNILDPNEPWNEAEYVKTYLQHTAVVRHEIIEALKSPAPVRIPMKFVGTGTESEFQKSMPLICRYLGLDFEYACYTNDRQRALDDIRLIGNSIDALNSDFLIAGGSTHLILQQIKDSWIRRSLRSSQWTEMELRELLELSNSSCISNKQWHDIFYSQICLTLMTMDGMKGGKIDGSLSDGRNPSPLADEYFGYLTELEVAIQLPTKSRSQFFEHEKSKSKFSSGIRLVASWFYHVVSTTENARHWTRTAIALRLYQKLHGGFPEKLTDLQTVGLTSEDTSLVNGTPFGYEVEDDIAYLWTADFSKSENESISDTRPKLPESSVNQYDGIEHLLELL